MYICIDRYTNTCIFIYIYIYVHVNTYIHTYLFPDSFQGILQGSWRVLVEIMVSGKPRSPRSSATMLSIYPKVAHY